MLCDITIKEKIKTFLDNNIYILLSGCITFLIMQFIAMYFKYFPYGDNTILYADLAHQYGPLLTELYDRLTSGSSLIYSWKSGLGSAFIGNFFNYLSSPLTFIILLFKRENLSDAIYLIISLKAILSSITFAYYLKTSYSKNSPIITPLSIAYAFCGYFIAYYWNLMWLDAIFFFPIIILGIEKIVNENNAKIFCVSFTLAIFANYYIAYMIGLFSVIYIISYYFITRAKTASFDIIGFICLKVSLPKSLKIIIKKYIKAVIISLLLSAVVIIPIGSILTQSSATSVVRNNINQNENEKLYEIDNYFEEYQIRGNIDIDENPIVKSYFSTFQFIKNHLPGTESQFYSDTEPSIPNIYSSMLPLLLLPLFFLNKNICKREKFIYGMIIAVLYFSFNINILNLIWHGFHFPNDLPYRFSFIYSFMLLKLSFESIVNYSKTERKKLIYIYVSIFATVIVSVLFSNNATNYFNCGITIAVLTLYCIAIYKLSNNKIKIKTQKIINSVIIMALILEILISTIPNFKLTYKKNDLVSEDTIYQKITDSLSAYEHDTLYRIEPLDKDVNDNVIMDACSKNYNGVSVFSSMTNENVVKMQSCMGLLGNGINSLIYTPQTPVYNSLFSLKYFTHNPSYTTYDVNEKYYEYIFSESNIDVYKNRYPLSVAFMVNNEILNWNVLENDNPFIAQNDLFKRATGINNVFIQQPIFESEMTNLTAIDSKNTNCIKHKFIKFDKATPAHLTVKIVPNTNSNIYFYLNYSWSWDDTNNYIPFIDEFNVSNSKNFKKNEYGKNRIYDIGKGTKNVPIYITFDIAPESLSGAIELCAYAIDEEAFLKGYNILKSGNLLVKKNTDTYISGEITASQNGIVFTSIPYDSNWQVYIDGFRLSDNDIYKLSNALLGFKLSKGSHVIEFKYNNKYIAIGAFISLSTLTILGIYQLYLYRKQKLYNHII